MLATTPRRPAAEAEHDTTEIDDVGLKERVDAILSRHPAVGLAVGVVRRGRPGLFHAQGVADVAAGIPITEATIFRVASISKTFTAIAVMQLWEQGLIDLDAPANEYLRAFKLVSARKGFGPATVRHLMTHTAGVPEDVHLSLSHPMDFGESFEIGRPVPTLAEYYRGALRITAEPGTRFIYTDHGFATLGQIVEDVGGMPLDRHFRERIFEPLGMSDTDLVRSDRIKARLATGYVIGSKGARAVTDRQWVTAAASEVYSSPRDMALYAAALLGGGSNERGSVLKPETLRMMFEPQYQPDPRIPGIGLAFSRFNLGGHLAIEHEGVLPGFNSDLFAAPDDGVAVLVFTNGSANAMLWLPGETSRLLGQLIGVPEDVIRTDVPHHPEIWRALCGWYRLPARLTDVRARLMMGAGVEVFVRNGLLTLRIVGPIPAAYRGFVLHPDDPADPYVFRIDLSQLGIGTAQVVFSRDQRGVTTRAHLDLMPMSLEKASALRNPRPWVAAAAGAVAVGAVAGIALHRRSRS